MMHLTPDTIKKYVHKLQDRGYNEAEITTKITNVHKLLEWAYETDQIHYKNYQQIKDEIDNTLSSIARKQVAPVDAVPIFDQYEAPKDDVVGLKSTKLPAFEFQPQYFIVLGLLLVLVAVLGAGLYDRFFKSSAKSLAYPSTPVVASRILSFQGRLTDSLGNPITTATNMRFRLYDDATAGTTLYNSGVCSITPDQDGVHNVLIGSDCGAAIASSVFTENASIWLGVTVGSDSEMTPRQRIANVPYALNAETLQGFPLGSSASTVPFISQGGEMLIAAATPTINSAYASQTFVIGGAGAVTLQSAGSGDVTLNASESGTIKFLTGGSQHGIVTNAGLFGFGTAGPDAKLDVLATSGEQLRLTYTDGSAYTGFTTSSGGDLTIDPSGDDLTIGGDIIAADTFTLQVGGKTGTAYSAFANSSDAPEEAAISADNDIYVGGDLEVDGVIYGNVSGTISPGFTQGSIVFADGSGNLAQDNASLFFDDTNNRVGIGDSTPDGKLEVSGASIGKALAIFNETGDQNIITASASGTTVANLDRSGNLAIEGAISDLSGATLAINDDVQVNGNDILDSGANTRVTLGSTTTLTNSTLTLSGTTTLTASSLTALNCSDCIDFDDLSDSLSLDAATTITNALAGNLTLNLSSTGDFVIQDNGTPKFTFNDSGNLDVADTVYIGLGSAAGRIVFSDAATDELDVQNATLDLNTNLITNIGNAGTDFDSSGGLTLAADLAVNGGDLTSTATTFNFDIGNTGTLNFRDGTNALVAIKDKGVYPFVNLAGKTDTGDPVSCAEGDLYYNSFDNTMKVCHDSNTWVALDSTGSGSAAGSDGQVQYNDGGAFGGATGLYYDDVNNVVGIGTTTPTGKLTVSGAAIGKALAIFNETGDQNIITASASGTTVASLDRSGNLAIEGAISDLSDATLAVNDNLDVSGTLTSGTADAFTVNATGNITTSGTTGLTFSSTGGIVLAGGTISDGTDEVDINDSLAVSSILQVGGTSAAAYSRFGTASTTHTISGADALLVSGALEVDGTLYTDGGIDTALTAGSVVFAGTNGVLSEDNSNFFWDDTNNKLGLGTTAPDGKFQVTGAAIGKALAIFNETGGQDILVGSASGTTRFRVANDGTVYGGYFADISNTAYGIDPAGTSNFGGYSLKVTGGAILAYDSGNVGIGNTTPAGKLDVNGAAIGKALTILNEAGDQNILTASASGTTVANLDRSGNLAIEGAISDLSGATLAVNDNLDVSGTLFAGTGDAFQVDASGNITAVGGTFSGDIAVNGDDITGDSNLTINAASYVRIGDTASPGSANGDDDLFVEGDLEVDGVLYLDGTLDTTFTAGSVVFAGTNGVLAQDNSSLFFDDANNKLGLGTASPTGKFTLTGAATGKALAILNETGDQNILTASASGVTVANLDRSGNLSIEGAINDISGNLVLNDVVDIGSATTGVNVTTAGVLSDIDGNLILNDTVDIGSASTGIRIDTSGNIIDIDGNIVLNDVVDIGSATTGLNITTAGLISDTDGAVIVGDDFQVNGNTTIGDASGDTLTANAATWTFANDTAITLSGGLNGINFDSNTLSIDATNNRIGIGTAAPNVMLDLSSSSGGEILLEDSDLSNQVYPYQTGVGRLREAGSTGGLVIDGVSNSTSVSAMKFYGLSHLGTNTASTFKFSGSKTHVTATEIALSSSETLLSADNFGTTELTLSGGGALAIEGALSDISQGTLEINDDLQVDGNDILDSGAATRITLGSTTTLTNTTLTLSGTTTLTASSLTALNCSDCADFDDLEDTLDLDAALTLNQSTNTWTQNFTGTTTDGLTYNGNSLTSGNLIKLSSTSTSFTSGAFISADWSPGSTTTNSGDLFVINTGGSANLTGNYINMKKNGSTLFKVVGGSGNVSTEGDLAINGGDITSSAGLTIDVNTDIVTPDKLTVGSSSAGVGQLTVTGAQVGKALTILNETGDQNILVASSSGTSAFVLTHNGDISKGESHGVNALGDSATIVPNGSFEVNSDTGNNKLPDGWSVNAGSVTVTTDSKHGTYAVATTKNGDDAIDTCIPIAGNTSRPYTASVWAKGSTASSSFRVGLYTYTSRANCVSNSTPGEFGMINTTAGTSWATYSGDANPATLGTTAIWGRPYVKNLDAGNDDVTFDGFRIIPTAVTTGLDLAETYPAAKQDHIQIGEIVAMGSQEKQDGADVNNIKRSSKTYDNLAFGVIATKPGLVLDDDKQYEKVQVALKGRVPVLVTTENGPIHIGDPITASSVPGVGMKATKPGRILGYAMTQWTNPDPHEIDQVTLFVNPESWAPAGVLTNGELYDGTISQASASGNFVLTNSAGEIIDNAVAFSKLMTAEIKTGLLSAQKLVVGIAQAGVVETKQLFAETIQAGSAIIGNLTADSITSKTISAVSITSDAVDAKAVKAESLAADTLSAKDATISGTLTADEIDSQNIRDLRHRIEMAVENEASSSAEQQSQFSDLLANVEDIQGYISSMNQNDDTTNDTTYQQAPNDVALDAASIGQLLVTDKAEMYSGMVLGNFTIGNISIENDTILALTDELKLSALERINLLDGAVMIARDGTIKAKGEVIAEKGIRTNTIMGVNDGDKVAIQNSRLAIENMTGQEVASINASGSAYFADLSLGRDASASGSGTIIAAADNFAQNGIFAPAVISNAASAGNAVLPHGENELIIFSNKVTEKSLVYVTATSPTQNKALYVASKLPCPAELASVQPSCKPYFKVAIDSSISSDITFNWWIVN